jgi:hypothetical protein
MQIANKMELHKKYARYYMIVCGIVCVPRYSYKALAHKDDSPTWTIPLGVHFLCFPRRMKGK